MELSSNTNVGMTTEKFENCPHGVHIKHMGQ